MRVGLLFRRATAALLCAVLAGGCSIGDVRRPPPTPEPAPASPTRSVGPVRSPPPVGSFEVRRFSLPIPAEYDQPYVEFVSADQGYAHFSTCLPGTAKADCPALLITTTNGGRYWQSLPHPRSFAENHQVYASPGMLLILAEPHGWYASIDGGVTFRHTPPTRRPPPEYHSIFGRYSLDEETGRVGEWRGGRFDPLPHQPPVSEPNTVTEHRGMLFVAGTPGNEPRAASSVDGGRSWRLDDVPYPYDEQLTVLRVLTSSDGDRWLVGEPANRTSFPRIWRYASGAWLPVLVTGAPARAISVAPIGGGLLLVTGPTGSGLVGAEGYQELGWPIGGESARVLDDGTVFAVRAASGEIVLGVGRQLDRGWLRLELTRS